MLEILDDYGNEQSISNDRCSENVVARLEFAVTALNRVIPNLATSTSCFAFLTELSRNFRLLALEGKRKLSPSTQSTNVAIYSLDAPPVVQTRLQGRPKLQISKDALLELRSFGFKWRDIPEMLLVSRWTLRRRVVEFGIEGATGFSSITNDELYAFVKQFMDQHYSLVGCSIISGHLRSLGFKIQCSRIRATIARVDPVNVRLRWAVVVC